MTIYTPESKTQIYEQGLRPYTGPRRAPSSAVWTLWAYTCGRILGRRRRFRHKIVPILAGLQIWLSATIIILFLAWPQSDWDITFDAVRAFHSWGIWGILLLATTIPSRILSQDRTGGLFALYMISPISRFRYVAAQGLALVGVMVLLFLPAQAFLFLVSSLLGKGPGGAMDYLNFLWRIPVGSIALVLVPVAVGMAGGSLVKKGGVGFLISAALFLVPSVVLGNVGASEEYYLLSFLHLSRGMASYVFQEDTLDIMLRSVSFHWVILANLAWAVAGFAFVWWTSRKWSESS